MTLDIQVCNLIKRWEKLMRQCCSTASPSFTTVAPTKYPFWVAMMQWSSSIYGEAFLLSTLSPRIFNKTERSSLKSRINLLPLHCRNTWCYIWALQRVFGSRAPSPSTKDRSIRRSIGRAVGTDCSYRRCASPLPSRSHSITSCQHR